MTEVSEQARRLPSLDGLRAFEVASRHMSFTSAAAELFVTQGAVSQRIKALEHELGVALFHRSARGLSLTREGEHLSHGIRTGLGHIVDAVARLSAPELHPVLILSVLPSFAVRWLIPRLPRLTELCPDLHIQLLAESTLADLHARKVHAALRFAPRPPPGFVAVPLMHDSVAPVCSPALLRAASPLVEVADLARVSILYDSSAEEDTSGTGWRSWLAHVGHGHLHLPAGQGFSQADLTLQAAVNGLGVALARTSLILGDLSAGRLVQLPFPAMPTSYSYYLLCLPETEGDSRFIRLRQWLLGEVHVGGERLSTTEPRG